MKTTALQLARLSLIEYDFHLLWNVKAMLDWFNTEMTDDQIVSMDHHALAVMLHLMAREAAAACVYYGYQADDVPTEEELEAYFDHYALPWELSECVVCISAALQYGNDREYSIKDDDKTDIDTLELKKN